MLNSDNINITGESFDYGPWRFTPEWDDGFTAAYFDETGLYAFGRQPEAIHWDLAQLAGCLALIAEAPPLSDLLARLGRAGSRRRWSSAARAGWGLSRAETAEDRALAAALIKALQSREVGDRPLLLRLARRARSRRRSLSGTSLSRARAQLSKAAQRQPRARIPIGRDAEPCSMHIEEVEAIWAAIAEHDDWAAVRGQDRRHPPHGRGHGRRLTAA